MRRRDLLTQVLVVNLLLVAAAVIVTAIATNSEQGLLKTPEAGLVLGGAVALTIIFNVILLQRRFRPLERAGRPDGTRRPLAPRSEPERSRRTPAVRRRSSACIRRFAGCSSGSRPSGAAPRARALAAQEEERARVARDLHDEVNQSLTGLLLRLEAAREKAPPQLASELAETRGLANRAMQELLALARQLRPPRSTTSVSNAALAGAVRELDRQGDVSAGFEASGELGDLPGDVQLVVYRVAQEALSNAARHSDAGAVSVRLARRNGSVELAGRRRRARVHLRSGLAGARDRGHARAGAARRRGGRDHVATGSRHTDSAQRADSGRRSRSTGGG